MKMDRESRASIVQLAYASSIGIAMVLVIFGGLFFGNYLDGKFGGGHRFTFIFLVIGIGIAFKNLYDLVKRYSRDEAPFIKSVKSEPHRKRPPPSKA